MADRLATYKGRTYKLLYLGKTKFGHKAKLGFMDGSKEFWVDSNLVSEKSGYSSEYTTRMDSGRCTCSECARGSESTCLRDW